MKKNFNYQLPVTDQLNKPVFFMSAGILLFFAVATLLFTDIANKVIDNTLNVVSTAFGWYYLLAMFCFFIFVIYIACSHFGKIKIGPSHSEPEFSLFAWASMLFAAGIGVDLLFFSVAEPVTQYMTPPGLEGQSLQAAQEAVLWTLFHYGLSGWCVYSLMGMALGFFSYRYNLPLTIRSSLYPIFGEKINGWIGHSVDIAALLGAVFGIATTLGIGVEQLNYGMYILFGLPENFASKIGLIVLTVVISLISSISGVNKGIKILSILNVLLAIGLIIFLIIFGNTEFLFNALIQNTGDYFNFLPTKMLETFAFKPQKEWMNSWTLFFWAWWIAWAPFVGLFLARISRGRTIRQFVFGSLFIPFLFILIWISIFGNSALNVIMQGNSKLAEEIINIPHQGFYSLLAEYPYFKLTAFVATVTGLFFYVTSADSGALVLGNFSSKLSNIYKDSPKWLRIFWSIVIGLITIAMLMANGINALQEATIIMGLPFSFVIFLVMYGLYRSLKLEDYRITSQTIKIKPATDHIDIGSIQQRLDKIETFPDAAVTLQILNKVCLPAFQTIKQELEHRNKTVILNQHPNEEDNSLFAIEMIVIFTEEQDFIYRIEPKKNTLPPYQEYLQAESSYYRLESFLLEGGQNDNLITYNKEQIISDILDKYESHLHFLHLNRKAPGDSLIFPNPE